MFTIKQVSRLTGVPATTLRAWEKRYGIGARSRTDGGYRLYDSQDVATLSRMAQLVRAGWAPSLAAQETSRAGVTTTVVTPVMQAPLPPETVSLIEAARRFDASEVSRIIVDEFASAPFPQAVDAWLMPTLAAVGDAWTGGELDIACEHLVSNIVRDKLTARLEASRRAAQRNGSHRPRVLLGLLPGSRHELGMLAFGIAVAELEIEVFYLGADVPLASWEHAWETLLPDALVTTLTLPQEVQSLVALVSTLRPRPGAVMAVGGALQEAAPAPSVGLGHRIGEASVKLATLCSTRGDGMLAGQVPDSVQR